MQGKRPYLLFFLFLRARRRGKEGKWGLEKGRRGIGKRERHGESGKRRVERERKWERQRGREERETKRGRKKGKEERRVRKRESKGEREENGWSIEGKKGRNKWRAGREREVGRTERNLSFD